MRLPHLVCFVVRSHNNKLRRRNFVDNSAFYTRSCLRKLNETKLFCQLSPAVRSCALSLDTL